MKKKRKINYNDRNFCDQITILFNQQLNPQPNIVTVPTIIFQITDNCNLQCSYCYEINKSNHVMSIETAKKFIDLLLENNQYTQMYLNTEKSLGVVLDFIGGEPFLYPKLMDEIIQYFIKTSIEKNHPWQYLWRINISTNGTLYNNSEVEQFIKKYKKYLSLTITIDGNKQLHDSCRCFPDGSGSYDLAVDMLNQVKIIQPNFYMGSKITLSPNNISFLYDAIINFIDLGFDVIAANCIFEAGWEYSHAKIFYQQLKQIADFLLKTDLDNEVDISLFNKVFFKPLEKTDIKNWCGGNGRMLCVDWSGTIYPCLRYTPTSLGNTKPIILGDVNNGILTTSEQQEINTQLKNINRINQSTKECINCPIAAGCAYCQAFNYQDSGNLYHRATYICCMHQARSLANVYFWNKYFQKIGAIETFKMYLSKEKALNIISEEEYNMLYKLQEQ